jgi:hypothetical protein
VLEGDGDGDGESSCARAAISAAANETRRIIITRGAHAHVAHAGTLK